MENKTEIGKKAEELAVSYLIKNEYEILERNYFVLGGEIDIIAKKDEGIVFCEVKFTTTQKFSSISEKVPLSKKKKLMKSAKLYLKTKNINPFEVALRFDLLFIFKDEIKHIENFIVENEVS